MDSHKYLQLPALQRHKKDERSKKRGLEVETEPCRSLGTTYLRTGLCGSPISSLQARISALSEKHPEWQEQSLLFSCQECKPKLITVTEMSYVF